MQINKNQVIEISLKDLFFHVLYRWRSILIAALIGAIVLCGYQYLSIKKVHDAGEQTKEERQYQINLQQYREDLASSRNTIKVYTKLLEEQNDYLNNSTYIQMSPQNAWVASTRYLIKPDQSVMDSLAQGSAIDPADSILPLYTSPLSEITNEEDLKKAFGTEKTEYINELVITSTNVDNNTVTIFVLGESKEAAQAGLGLLNEQMINSVYKKANEVTPHQLVKASESLSRGLDSIARTDKEMTGKIDLSAKQETLAKTTETNQETLQKARQKLDKLDAKGEPHAPGQHLIKMSVIGFILGAVLLAFLYAVLYAINGRLKNAQNLSERYRLPIFGEFPVSDHLRSNKGLDKLFSKWELGKDAPNDETVYNNIAALIAEKQTVKSILLVSTLPAETMITISEALARRLPEKNIRARADLIHNSEAITESAEADAVIITEAKDLSKLKAVDRMAETLIIAEANVIGAIIL